MVKLSYHTNTPILSLNTSGARTSSEIPRNLPPDRRRSTARDYYPQAPDAIYKASAEHLARMTKVRAGMAELQEIADHLALA